MLTSSTKTTAKDQIRKELELAILCGFPFRAVHELHLESVSQCAASARLREMSRDGEVVGRIRLGKQFKEWALVDIGEKI
jgi:pyridoxine 5'-phosphate synthase PdxJ